jgi:hypothetical protein
VVRRGLRGHSGDGLGVVGGGSGDGFGAVGGADSGGGERLETGELEVKVGGAKFHLCCRGAGKFGD